MDLYNRDVAAKKVSVASDGEVCVCVSQSRGSGYTDTPPELHPHVTADSFGKTSALSLSQLSFLVWSASVTFILMLSTCSGTSV